MAAPVRLFKRNPFSYVRGWSKFKKNMQEMAKVADDEFVVKGFTGIARDIKTDMNWRLRSKLAPETSKYLRWKSSRMQKRKTGATYTTSLRNKGIVAKPFMSKGKGKSFVAIHYKYAPHNWWIEQGTAERVRKSGGRTGRVPSKTFDFFRPTVNEWRRSGMYVARVEQVMKAAVNAKARGMTV